MPLYYTHIDTRLVARANCACIYLCVCVCVCVKKAIFNHQIYNSPSNHGYVPIYH